MNTKSTILFPLFLLIGINLGAQAWTKNKGAGFYKLDYSTIQATSVFGDDGEITDTKPIGNNVLSFYGEYGLAERLTLTAYVPMAFNSFDDLTIIGFGDPDISLTYGIKQSGFVISATALAGIPLGISDEETSLRTGDGEWNQMIRLNAGTGGPTWWTQAYVGFNNRTNDYSDEVRFGVEVGHKWFSDKLYTILRINNLSSLKNGNKPANPLGLYSNDVAYFSPALELMYKFTDSFGVALRGGGAFSAANTQAAPQVSIGVFMDINK